LWQSHVILSHTPPCSCKSKEKEKEKKRNINNDLDVLPSHDIGLSSCTVPWSAVTCVVAYFRRTELLLEVQKRDSI